MVKLWAQPKLRSCNFGLGQPREASWTKASQSLSARQMSQKQEAASIISPIRVGRNGHSQPDVVLKVAANLHRLICQAKLKFDLKAGASLLLLLLQHERLINTNLAPLAPSLSSLRLDKTFATHLQVDSVSFHLEGATRVWPSHLVAAFGRLPPADLGRHRLLVFHLLFVF